MATLSIKGNLFNLGVKRISRRRQAIIKELFDEVENDFQQRMQKVYRTHTSGRSAWKPNDPTYVHYGKQKGRSPKVYFNPNPGERSKVTKAILTRGKGKRTKNTIIMGSNVPAYLVYSLYSKINSRRIPIRDPFLEIFRRDGRVRPEVAKKWQRKLNKYLPFL